MAVKDPLYELVAAVGEGRKTLADARKTFRAYIAGLSEEEREVYKTKGREVATRLVSVAEGLAQEIVVAVSGV